MDAETLKQKQSPIKSKFLKDADAAKHTLMANGRLELDSITCELDTFAGKVKAGFHPACGGDETQACSANMLLDALVGCTGVTLGAVATAMRLGLEHANVVAEGDIDFRGTMGVDRQVPVGFTEIRLRLIVAPLPEEKTQQKLIELVERYCVVYQTLAPGVEIRTSVEAKSE